MRDRRPIRTARRKARRLARLGTRTPCCVYCGETAIECLELHHVVGRKLDSKFKEIHCRNCHRKIEFRRDIAGLSSNGIHKSHVPTEPNGLYMRLLGLAESHESAAQALRRWAKEIKSKESHSSLHARTLLAGHAQICQESQDERISRHLP